MVETMTIKIDEKLKQALLARGRLLNEDIDTIVNRVLKDFVEQSTFEQSDDVKELPFVRDFLSKYQRNGNEMLPCGLTLDEYMSLEESEREKLWEEAYRQELDKNPESEREANPNAIPAGQGVSAEVRRRLRQLREQRKAHR